MTCDDLVGISYSSQGVCVGPEVFVDPGECTFSVLKKGIIISPLACYFLSINQVSCSFQSGGVPCGKSCPLNQSRFVRKGFWFCFDSSLMSWIHTKHRDPVEIEAWKDMPLCWTWRCSFRDCGEGDGWCEMSMVCRESKNIARNKRLISLSNWTTPANRMTLHWNRRNLSAGWEGRESSHWNQFTRDFYTCVPVVIGFFGISTCLTCIIWCVYNQKPRNKKT